MKQCQKINWIPKMDSMYCKKVFYFQRHYILTIKEHDDTSIRALMDSDLLLMGSVHYINTYKGSKPIYSVGCGLTVLRVFIGMETAALTFRTKQYSTGHSSHICYGKHLCNDFLLNHNYNSACV